MESLVGREAAEKLKKAGKMTEDEMFDKASRLSQNEVKMVRDFFKDLTNDSKKQQKQKEAK